MTIKQPFFPKYASTQTLSATTTNQVATIARGNKQLCIKNKGTSEVYIRAYDSSNGIPVASATDFPILSGESEVITIAEKFDKIAYICATGTATVLITPGEGW